MPGPDLHRAVPRSPWKWLLVFLRIKMTVDLSLGETFLDRLSWIVYGDPIDFVYVVFYQEH